jgi:hypothetical protein
VIVDIASTQQWSTGTMRIPTWRLALTGGAIAILAVAGIGFAAASSAPTAPAGAIGGSAATGTTNVATTDLATDVATDVADPGTGLALDFAAGVQANERLGPAAAGRLARIMRAGRHLVHAEITVTDRDGNLVHLQLDHGTVQSIGGGTLVIAEAGGGTETVSTGDATIVRVGRTKGDLGDVTVGAEVFVQSRVDGSTVLAKRIIVIPAAAGA